MLRRLMPVFLSLSCAPQLPSILTTEASCGDGHLHSGSGEACDDGNQDQTDGCLNNCQLARCGDGTVRRHQNEGDPVETCDDGNSNDRDACTNACETARCGDGILRSDLDLDDGAYEVCDDGNEFSGDLCTINCRLPSCGDGWRQGD